MSLSTRSNSTIGSISLDTCNLPDLDSVKPWLQSKQRRKADQKVHWTFCAVSLIFGFGAVFALFLSAFLARPPSHKYCLVLDEQFDGDTIDSSVWTHEQQTGGWRTGEFDWTTASTNNSFIKNGSLYIVPTLTADMVGYNAVIDGYTLNLTEMGTCTSPNRSDFYCTASSNISTNRILPPIQTARLSTKLSGKSIQFGKVEITARMPTGDWIWPAVSMLPVDEIYGNWPLSGEIDLFESKGNPSRDRNDFLSSGMSSTLHWGPLPILDSFRSSTNSFSLFQHFWNEAKHTFGMVWDENSIVTWQRTRAYEVLNYKFGGKNHETFWDKGNYPTSLVNGTILNNPWTTSSGANVITAAPFDQDFYLVLSVAVGSTNGYFSDWDAIHGKPWSDDSNNPQRDFWESRETWLPSWPSNPDDRAMIVDSVKIWQQCD